MTARSDAETRMFELHPRLAADCFDLGDLSLCRLLLMNDARFPWCILVPRIEGLRDFHDVPREERLTLFDEIERVSKVLAAEANAIKMNVAALGNMVPQLHVHVIARTANDAAWPGPVWNAGPAVPYADASARIAALKRSLALT
jgi:diadenosine tetraphosphate (Ap4A) HIT family hydrolase